MTTRETFDRMREQGFAYSGYSYRDKSHGWITKWVKTERIETQSFPGRTTLAWTNESGAVVSQEVYSAKIDEQGRFWRSTVPVRS